MDDLIKIQIKITLLLIIIFSFLFVLGVRHDWDALSVGAAAGLLAAPYIAVYLTLRLRK